MKLYGSLGSPFVRHCRIVLAQLGFEYSFEESTPMDMDGKSHTMRIPFFEDGDVQLTDSKSIIHYLRKKAGQEFLPDYKQTELFATATTGLDACVNIFIMSMLELTPNEVPYLHRHTARVQAILGTLEAANFEFEQPYDDVAIRIATFADYGRFRGRFTLDSYPRLQALLDEFKQWAPFADTTPQ